ncbi:MAG: nuclear transport factor 2 family protein [Gemmatimonadetes bacterium]|nr:nuclear transport factor 2 family protein [Gemmatimonadota bacterium]
MLHRNVLALVAVAALTGAWLFAPTSPTLSAADLAEIQSLYARYNWALDEGDAEGWASTFTTDGVFAIEDQGAAGISAGHDAIVKFAHGFRASIGKHVKHWNTNLELTPTATGARGRVYLILVDFGTKPASIATSATYADELVKSAQGWRFTKRAVKGDRVP